jgi:hypothetical protein
MYIFYRILRKFMDLLLVTSSNLILGVVCIGLLKQLNLSGSEPSCGWLGSIWAPARRLEPRHAVIFLTSWASYSLRALLGYFAWHLQCCDHHRVDYLISHTYPKHAILHLQSFRWHPTIRSACLVWRRLVQLPKSHGPWPVAGLG